MQDLLFIELSRPNSGSYITSIWVKGGASFHVSLHVPLACCQRALLHLGILLLQDMEDTLKGWFAEFHAFLNYDNPALTDKDPDKESPVDAVKAAVCQNINLFMEMNEEEFKDYLQTFVQDIWTLLVAVKQGSGQVLSNFAAPSPLHIRDVHNHKQYMLSIATASF